MYTFYFSYLYELIIFYAKSHFNLLNFKFFNDYDSKKYNEYSFTCSTWLITYNPNI